MTPARVVTVTSAGVIRGSIGTTTWPLDGRQPGEYVTERGDERISSATAVNRGHRRQARMISAEAL